MSLRYPLVLASGSPRRRALLAEAGYVFEVAPADVLEPAAPECGSTAEAVAWVEAMAYYKARSVATGRAEAVIVGADTVVVHDGCIIGKPRDEAHARQLLTEHFAGRNDVITGLAVLCPAASVQVITHVSTVLMMRAMTDEELAAYLGSGAWRDKAGAYALQEGGDKFVETMEGSESNVVGLPMEALERVLGEVGEACRRCFEKLS